MTQKTASDLSGWTLDKIFDYANEGQTIRKFKGSTGHLKPADALYVLRMLAETGKINDECAFNHFKGELMGDVASFQKGDFAEDAERLKANIFKKSQKYTARPIEDLSSLGVF